MQMMPPGGQIFQTMQVAPTVGHSTANAIDVNW